MAAGILTRLARNTAGNTLAVMAMMLIPLAAFSGSAIDIARLYVVKVRLQQACDAGVLAGRKFMTDNSSLTPLDSNAATQAQTFFANNFKSGWFTTNLVSFTPAKTADSQVSGIASATVPMSIMKMFGMQPVAINVNCEARYDVADTDIMFVLDTTGSMSCLPTDSESTCSSYVGGAGTTSYVRPDGTTGYYVPEKSGSRISYLRSAVLNFYDTIVKYADPTTKLRYGFVTYTSTVNAGSAVYALSPGYLVDSYNYQTRYVTADYTISSTTATNASATTQAQCDALDSRTPAPALTYDPSTGTATQVDASWIRSGLKNICSVVTSKLGPTWTYAQKALSVKDYAKTVAAGTIPDPTRVDGSTTKWQGCVEERDTTAGATSFDQTNLPNDLNPDLIPTAADATRWRPMWPDAEYARNSKSSGYPVPQSTGNDTSNGDDTVGDPNMNDAIPLKTGYMTCGKPVGRLTTMSRADVSGFVNASDFRAIGGTYHDTGMIWGTRMIAPKGIFANDTAPWPGHQQPNRVIVFVTDGDMAPNQNIYGMYGFEYFDKRVTNGNLSTIKDYHNARFLAECQAAQARNIDVWVVAVGQAVTDQLKACATTDSQALYAGTGDDLTAAFATIAKRVALLRISK